MPAHENGYDFPTRKLVIVQTILPHYRLNLFRELSRHPQLRAVIIAGRISYSFVKSVSNSDNHYIEVNNHFLFNRRFVIQNLPHQAIQASVTILSFDPRILSNYPILIIRKLLGRPTILWGIGLSARTDSPSWVVQLRRGLAHFANALILYNESGKDNFVKLGISPEKIFIAPNAIELNEIWDTKTQVKSQTRSHLLFIGRLAPKKQVHRLIEAFAMIHQEKLAENIDLLVIGDGPERSHLEELAKSLDISHRVHFLGSITDQLELAKYFGQALISVAPGNIGLAALHSLAFDVPLLVARDAPHGPEVGALVHDFNGRFYDPGSSNSLANALRTMLSDRDALARMRNNAADSVRDSYSIDQMVNAFKVAVDYVLA